MDRDNCIETWYACDLSMYVDLSPFHSGGNAVISLIFAEYINRLFWSHSRDEVSPDDIPQWAVKLTAVGAVVMVTMICMVSRNLGSRAAVVFTTIKVGTLSR